MLAPFFLLVSLDTKPMALTRKTKRLLKSGELNALVIITVEIDLLQTVLLMGLGVTHLHGSLRRPSRFGSRPSKNSSSMLSLISGVSLIQYGKNPGFGVVLIILITIILLFEGLSVM